MKQDINWEPYTYHSTTDLSYYHVNNSVRISQSQLPVNLTINKLRPNTGYILTVSISLATTSSVPVPLAFVTPARGS